MKTNIYDQITNKIIEQLEQGIIPWQKPWMAGSYKGCISHTNGKPYSMLNQMLLDGRTGEWLTYNQIQAEGGKVKKGEKASLVVFWSFVNKIENEAICDENGNEIGIRQTITDSYPVLKGYNVFHIEQCEGIKPRFNNTPIRYEHTPIEEADKVAMEYVAREGIKLEIDDTDRACYNPITDRVRVPKMAQYKDREEYYSTLFHELTHSTGHEKRLNRPEMQGLAMFGDSEYSKEELTAEMGAAFLCHQLQIDGEKAFRNSAAYIQGWLKKLHDDRKMIVSAAAKAERAVEYIMTGNK